MLALALKLQLTDSCTNHISQFGPCKAILWLLTAACITSIVASSQEVNLLAVVEVTVSSAV